MSESEGLQKLTEYLKQTRRQAEIAIDNLNNQVISLRHENDELRAVNENLRKEKLQAEAAVQQLKVENTNKWKLRERDEWKALVESLQQERDQLQDECNNLHAKLMTAQSDLEFMRHDMSELSVRYGEIQLSLMEAQSDLATAHSQQQQPQSLQKVRRFSSADDDEPPYSEEKGQTMFTSPVLDRTGRTINFDSYSPASVAQKLKHELRRANEQLKQDHVAQSEQQEKIRSLEKQLKQYEQDNSNHSNGHHFPSKIINGNKSPNGDSQMISSQHHHHYQRRNEGWLFNIWGFVFPASPPLPKAPQRSLLTV